MSLLAELRDLFDPPLTQFEPDAARRANLLAMIRPNTTVAGVDYQANFAMPLAKQLGIKPQVLAEEVVARLPANALIESATVAGPGFINVTLASDGLAERVRRVAADDKLGLRPAERPKRVVIDYSGPNVAKPLHVGHLRSTIIGDAIVRILRALGHHVTGDNHLGDWGTQFGILIFGLQKSPGRRGVRARPRCASWRGSTSRCASGSPSRTPRTTTRRWTTPWPMRAGWRRPSCTRAIRKTSPSGNNSCRRA